MCVGWCGHKIKEHLRIGAPLVAVFSSLYKPVIFLISLSVLSASRGARVNPHIPVAINARNGVYVGNVFVLRIVEVVENCSRSRNAGTHTLDAVAFKTLHIELLAEPFASHLLIEYPSVEAVGVVVAPNRTRVALLLVFLVFPIFPATPVFPIPLFSQKVFARTEGLTALRLSIPSLPRAFIAGCL